MKAIYKLSFLCYNILVRKGEQEHGGKTKKPF